MVAKSKNIGGRPRLYDWRQLLQQSILECGTDYMCSDKSMAQMVRNAAAARGLRVRVLYRDGTIEIVKRGR